MKKVVLKIEGMSCDGCRYRLEKFLNNKDDIKKAKVSLDEKLAYIECDDETSIDTLNEYVSDCGYESMGEVDEN